MLAWIAYPPPNRIDINGNFTITTVKTIQMMVECVTKDPEGTSDPSESDDEGEVGTHPLNRTMPRTPYYTD